MRRAGGHQILPLISYKVLIGFELIAPLPSTASVSDPFFWSNINFLDGAVD
jgi:hypothetical protein